MPTISPQESFDVTNITTNLIYKVAQASKRNSFRWANDVITEDEIIDAVKHPADRKECGNWMFGELNGRQRKTDQVVSRSVIAVDVDHPDPAFLSMVELVFQWKSIWHSTFNSTREAPRYRGYIFPDRDLSPAEYPTAVHRVMDDLGAHQFDPTSAEIARYMFKPAASVPEDYEHLTLTDLPPMPVDDELGTELLLDVERPPEKARAEDLPEPLRTFCLSNDDLDEANEDHDLGLVREGDRWRFEDKAEAGVAAVPGRDDLWQVFNANHPARGTWHMWDLVRLIKFSAEDQGVATSTPPYKRPSHAAMLRYAGEGVDGADRGLSSHMRIAARFAAHAQANSVYLHGAGWRKWTGTHWAADHHAVVAHQQLEEVIRSGWGEALNDKELQAAIRSANSGPGARSVLDLASRKLFVEHMDADPWVLNCANGTLDLRTLELRPHIAADKLSKVTTAAYHPEARSEVWERFLAEALPDSEVREYLQRYLGLSLVGKTVEHVMAILYGAGRNGKSVLAKAVTTAMGDYATTASNQLLVAGRYGGQSAGDLAAIMELRGARLATMSELDRGAQMNESAMKQLTGGDTITAKAMGQNFVEWPPSHSFLMLTNSLPSVAGDSEAAWARLHVVPFDVSFEGREDPTLDDKLTSPEVQDAILAWAVEGLRQYHRRRLDPPEAVLATTREYRTENDPVGRFVEERCILSRGATVGKPDLINEYNSWAGDNGEPLYKGKTFVPIIKSLVGVEMDGGRRNWRGIGLRDEFADE